MKSLNGINFELINKFTMFKKIIILSFLVSSLCISGFAQKTKDSTEVAQTLKEIVLLCKTVDFSDPKVSELGTFYKVAPYIVYRGEDKNRSWKVAADYTKEEEKKGVDEVCYKINNGINQDSNFVIKGFRTESESEGVWYVLTVSYIRKGKPKTSQFAFLKIQNKFLLGDID